MTKKCKIKHQLSSFMDGELPQDEADKVHGHIDTCEVCRNEIEAMRFSDDLVSGLQELEPSAGFEHSFWEKIANLEERGRHRSLSAFLTPWRRPLLATTLAATLMAGIFVFYKQAPAPGPQEILMAEHLELFEEYEIINRIDMFENLETLMTLKENSS